MTICVLTGPRGATLRPLRHNVGILVLRPAHRPGRESPMLDAGDPPPSAWIDMRDALYFDGRQRVNGGAIDIGATEDQSLFVDGLKA